MDGLSSQEVGTRVRVMIVEDEDDMRFLLERMLRLRGHTTVSFSDGQQALSQLDAYEPDAVVTDLRMPDMDGLELCARIKARYPHLGLILISAFGDLDGVVTAMRLGISDFLTKPIEMQELEGAIFRSRQRNLVQSRRSRLGDRAESLPSLEHVQQEHIQRVLEAVRGNKAAAARILGINRVTLYRKLAQAEVSKKT